MVNACPGRVACLVSMAAGSRNTRNAHLDVWRGLCLIDVVLVHLAYNGIGFPDALDQVVKHYTRFAAGGFVFVAGLTIALVIGPHVRASAAGRSNAYARLLRRAGLLVIVDVCASLVYRVLDLVRAFPADPQTSIGDAVYAIVALQRPGLTGGILLLYALLLSFMPVLFELQRRIGSGAVLLLSIVTYALAVATGEAFAWPSYDFPLLYWQPLYVAGFLTAHAHVWLHSGSARRVGVWCGLAVMAFVVVFLAHHGPTFGVMSVAELLSLDFRKTPLQPGALLWYLCGVQVVLAVSSWLWRHPLATTRGAALIPLLGRHSLLVYTAHVFTEIPLLEYVWRVGPSAWACVALACADLAALILLCAAVEAGVHLRMRASLQRALAKISTIGPQRWPV